MASILFRMTGSLDRFISFEQGSFDGRLSPQKWVLGVYDYSHPFFCCEVPAPVYGSRPFMRNKSLNDVKSLPLNMQVSAGKILKLHESQISERLVCTCRSSFKKQMRTLIIHILLITDMTRHSGFTTLNGDLAPSTRSMQRIA